MAKKTFSTRVAEDRIKALKHLAVDADKSLGALLEEAITDRTNSNSINHSLANIRECELEYSERVTKRVVS